MSDFAVFNPLQGAIAPAIEPVIETGDIRSIKLVSCGTSAGRGSALIVRHTILTVKIAMGARVSG